MPEGLFIGGTGRCGTTVLRESLRLHPEIAGVPAELRLLVDPGGLLDLARDVTRDWTPWRADAAFQRLGEMVNVMLDPSGRPYARYNLRRWFGEEALRQACEHLHDTLVMGKTETCFWTGTLPADRDTFYEVRWVTDPTEMADIMSGFIELLYAGVKPGARYWVDDTPDNLQHPEELCTLFGGTLIHIYRHPYDVVASMKRRRTSTTRWPGKTEANVARISQLLARWEQRPKTGFPWCEVRFERLVRHTFATLGALFERLGLDPDVYPWDQMPINSEDANIGRWRAELDKPELEVTHEWLKEGALHRGYDV